MRFEFVSSVLILLVQSTTVLTYPDGPPDELHYLVTQKNLTIKNTCIHMDPSVSNTHGKDGKQEGISPFYLAVDKKLVNHTETVTLTIRKRPNTPNSPSNFKGFLVQGINRENGETVGDFVVTENDPSTKKMHCFGRLGSAVSHKNPKLKSSLALTWKPPKFDKTTCVKFYATVLVNKEMFWVKKAINLVQIEKSSSDLTLPKSNFTCKDVDCANDCFLNSAATLFPLKMFALLFISIIFQFP